MDPEVFVNQLEALRMEIRALTMTLALHRPLGEVEQEEISEIIRKADQRAHMADSISLQAKGG